MSLAAARLAQARASVNAASAGLFPQAAVTAREQRLRISANRPLTNYAVPNQTTVQSDYAFTFAVAYEADLWGRVKGSIDASKASAEQAGADLENFRLIVATDLAANYFNLRQIDIELKVVNSAIELQRRALDLVSARHELGVASGLERAQQQAQLDATLTQVDLLRRQRYQFENAIATLIGKPAPVFSLPADSGGAIDTLRAPRRPCRLDCLPICSSVAPMSPRPSVRLRRPMRRSVSPAAPITRASRWVVRWALTAARSAHCSMHRAFCGRLACRWHRPSSMVAGSARTSISPSPAMRRLSQTTGGLC